MNIFGKSLSIDHHQLQTHEFRQAKNSVAAGTNVKTKESIVVCGDDHSDVRSHQISLSRHRPWLAPRMSRDVDQSSVHIIDIRNKHSILRNTLGLGAFILALLVVVHVPIMVVLIVPRSSDANSVAQDELNSPIRKREVCLIQ